MNIFKYFKHEEKLAKHEEKHEEKRAKHPSVVAFAANGRGAGKSFVATRLQYALEARGYKTARLAMTDRLRDVLATFLSRFEYPLPREALLSGKDKTLALYGWDGVRNKTGRDLLIAFGETMVDAMGVSFWADIWREKAKEFIEQGYVVVCDDIRRRSEIEAVRSLGGIVVYLNNIRARQGEMEGLVSPSDCDAVFDYSPSEHGLAFVLEYILLRFDQ